MKREQLKRLIRNEISAKISDFSAFDKNFSWISTRSHMNGRFSPLKKKNDEEEKRGAFSRLICLKMKNFFPITSSRAVYTEGLGLRNTITSEFSKALSFPLLRRQFSVANSEAKRSDEALSTAEDEKVESPEKSNSAYLKMKVSSSPFSLPGNSFTSSLSSCSTFDALNEEAGEKQSYIMKADEELKILDELKHLDTSKPEAMEEMMSRSFLLLSTANLQALLDLLEVISRCTHTLVKDSRIRQICDKALSLADDASLQQLTTMVRLLSILDARVHLRDVAQIFPRILLPEKEEETQRFSALKESQEDDVSSPSSSSLSPSSTEKMSKTLEFVVSSIKYFGDRLIFYSFLFDFASSRCEAMSAETLSSFIAECGRNGLRCKHYMDSAMLVASSDFCTHFTIEQLLKILFAISRFFREFSAFFFKIQRKLTENVAVMNASELELMLRICFALRNSSKSSSSSVKAFEDCCVRHLISKIDDLFESNEAFRIIQCMSKHSASSSSSFEFLTMCAEKIPFLDLHNISVKLLILSLRSLATWNISGDPIRAICDTLAARMEQIRYSDTLALWESAITSLGALRYLHRDSLQGLLEIASDMYMLERLSIFQQLRLMQSLFKLQLFHYPVYQNSAILLSSNLATFDLKSISQLLQPFACANFFHQRLFTEAYERCLQLLRERTHGETLSNTHKLEDHQMIILTWSFTVAKLHYQQSFSALLDSCPFPLQTKNRLSAGDVSKLHQIADVALLECPGVCGNSCMYTQMVDFLMKGKFAGLRAVDTVGISSSDRSAKERAVQELSEVLQQCDTPFEANYLTDRFSFCTIDFALSKEKKIGVLLLGGGHSLMRDLNQEGLVNAHTGHVAMKLRALRARGWQVMVLTVSEVSSAANLQQRHQLLAEKLLEATGCSLPPLRISLDK